MNDNYEFLLSSEDLFWFAKAFQIRSLHLPQDPLAKFSARAVNETLNRAQESLQRRGLIRHVAGKGWQVDPLPAAIIRWLGSASSMLALNIATSNGTSRLAHVFNEKDASMYVTAGEDKYHFLLLPDINALIDHFVRELGVSFLDLRTVTSKYILPQPVIILSTAWKDPMLAVKMLKVTGLTSKEIKPVLAWAETLEWAVTLNYVQLEVKDPGNEHQAILFGNKQKAWSGSTGGSADDAVILSPINMEELRGMIQRLLQN